ncbi:MAG: response regulator transcription factor [Gemmatimonadales bacterium]
MSARILLIEDEAGLVRTLTDRLQAEGYAVASARDGDRGYELARREAHDLLIVDSMLPGRSGVDVIRDLRLAGVRVPALMLTARSAVEDIVIALKLGADDYLTKPFRAPELLARIDALLRRSRAEPLTGERRVTVRDLEIDLASKAVSRAGRPVELSDLEFRLLAHLASHRGKTVSRAQLLREVWKYAPDTVSRTVDQHVAQLRRKLGGRGSGLIVTVHQRGYMLVPG